MFNDPDRFWAALAAIPGAAIYGFYHLAVLIKEGRRISRRDWQDLLLNVLCAILCGVILAWVLSKGPAIALIPWESVRDPVTVGFILGAFGWELLPFAFRLFGSRARKALDADGDAQ
jgi:uncharacterized membrane protein